MSASGVRARRRRSSAFPACWSARSISAKRRRAMRAARPPPILLIHGDQDPMIPFDAMFMAAEALAGASIPTQWHLSARDRPRHRRRGPAPGRPVSRQGVRGPKALGRFPEGPGRCRGGSYGLGFLGPRPFRLRKPGLRGFDFLGFPWILSSESRLINGLHGVIRRGNSFSALLSRVAAPCRAAAGRGPCGARDRS